MMTDTLIIDRCTDKVGIEKTWLPDRQPTKQWCIAKHGGGYTQKGVAYVYTVYPAYL